MSSVLILLGCFVSPEHGEEFPGVWSTDAAGLNGP